jgi:hypothetical protein
MLLVTVYVPMLGPISRLRAVGAAVLLVAVVSCGGAAAPTAPTQASVTLSVTPDPATAALCHPACIGASGNGYPFQVFMTAVITESARVSGNVDFINVAPVTDDGTELPVLGYGADEIALRAGTNHVDPAGTLSFPVSVLYSTGTSGAHLVVTMSMQFTDDKGHLLTGTATVNVEDPQAVSTDTGEGVSDHSSPVRAFAESK